MSQIRVTLTIDSSCSTSELLGLVRDSLRQYGGFPEPYPEDGMPLRTRTLPRDGMDEATAVCECCGCTWDTPCPGGCAWDLAAWAQGRAICTSCMSAELEVSLRKGVMTVEEARRRDADGKDLVVTAEKPRPVGKTDDARPSKEKDRGAEIERRLRAGEDVPTVAKAVGLTESAIYLRRKKLGITPPAKRAKRGANKAAWRCGHCSHVGQDPIRCDHCFERR